MSTVRLVAAVTGEVQGVGFRYRTRQQAEQLGLIGSASNRSDGSVLVVAAGPSSAVEQLLAWLRSADAPGRVENVEANLHDDGASGLSGFVTD
ncbi:acylphosphatase [Arthrobacter tumbae]|uniref:acylphosphatase n=1 Tax=Arthrobacter tumbae TaxID=163874 RepID=UPI0019575AE2|nr:acylphosphatase [Arthrobacter tumbae]MBM7780781.1 acylphosphatase [Arthrobacter tumbae]